jgi:hypothetical protein
MKNKILSAASAAMQRVKGALKSDIEAPTTDMQVHDFHDGENWQSDVEKISTPNEKANIKGVKIFPVGKEAKVATPGLVYCRAVCIGIVSNGQLVANAIIHYDGGDDVDMIPKEIKKWCKDNNIDSAKFIIRAVHEGPFQSIQATPLEMGNADTPETIEVKLGNFLAGNSLGFLKSSLTKIGRSTSADAEKFIEDTTKASSTYELNGFANALFSIDEAGNVSSIRLYEQTLVKAAKEGITVKAAKATVIEPVEVNAVTKAAVNEPLGEVSADQTGFTTAVEIEEGTQAENVKQIAKNALKDLAKTQEKSQRIEQTKKALTAKQASETPYTPAIAGPSQDNSKGRK